MNDSGDIVPIITPTKASSKLTRERTAILSSASATLEIVEMYFFREVSATHFIPYHLLLKWGSIYHRYKTHLIDGYDILDGCINPSYITRPLTGKTLFDNNGALITYTATNASSSGTTINVPSTVGLQSGMTVTVIAGTGQTAPNTFITNVTSTTGFTISQTPLTGLTGATIFAVYDEYVTFDVIPRISTTSGTTTGVTYTGYTHAGIKPFYQAVYRDSLSLMDSQIDSTKNKIKKIQNDYGKKIKVISSANHDELGDFFTNRYK